MLFCILISFQEFFISWFLWLIHYLSVSSLISFGLCTYKIIFFLVILYFIALWPDRICRVISIFLYLLRLVLWYIFLKTIPWGTDQNVLVFERNIYRYVRFTWWMCRLILMFLFGFGLLGKVGYWNHLVIFIGLVFICISNSSSILFRKMGETEFGSYMFCIIMSFWLIFHWFKYRDLHYLFWLAFIMNSILSSSRIATSACFLIPFTWNNCFHSLL